MRRIPPITIPEEATCGEGGLDRQHRSITLILNQLILQVSEAESPSHPLSCQKTLLDLGKASKAHFSQELQFLFRIGYPLVEDQIRAYKVFQTEITRAVGQIQHFRREEIVDLVGRLRAWWAHHLSVQSAEYLAFKTMVVWRLR